jgi:hypothetical protein
VRREYTGDIGNVSTHTQRLSGWLSVHVRLVAPPEGNPFSFANSETLTVWMRIEDFRGLAPTDKIRAVLTLETEKETHPDDK